MSPAAPRLGSATARLCAVGGESGRARTKPGRLGTARGGGECGQASMLLVAVMCAVALGALALAAMSGGLGALTGSQRAADLAALAGARALQAAYPRLFELPVYDGRPNPLHLSREQYLALGRRAAERVARSNGAADARVSFPEKESFAPVRIAVSVSRSLELRFGNARRSIDLHASAEAELAPAPAAGTEMAAGGGYDGPLAHRQGKPMRPDVALAFDRLEAAARADGVTLIITSAFRSDAEQAILFARRPDPRWVAPPGRSLHRNGTELDLGPASAYGWLAANARRFGFLQRYSWEPWHYGYTLNARSSPGRTRGPAGRGDGVSAVPSFVPAAYVPILGRAAQRWNVSSALLAAQIYAESNFNPFARSPAGAQGIAQFMPATAKAYGLTNPFDAAAAIDAQARMMRDLLRQFGSVPLALAAYNAGPGRVAACGCVPPFTETRAYVAKILGLMGGAGDLAAGGGLTVRLVR